MVGKTDPDIQQDEFVRLMKAEVLIFYCLQKKNFYKSTVDNIMNTSNTHQEKH